MENDIFFSIEFKWYEKALTLAKEIGGLEDVSKEFGKPENASLSLFVAMYSFMREQSILCNTNRKLLQCMVYELSNRDFVYQKHIWISDYQPGHYLAKSFINEHERVVRNSVSSLTRRLLFFLHSIESGAIISNDIDTVYCETPVVKREANEKSRKPVQIPIPPPRYRNPNTEEVI